MTMSPGVEIQLIPGLEHLEERASNSAPQSRCNSLRSRRRGSARREHPMRSLARVNSASLPDCTDTVTHQRKLSVPARECSLCTVRSFKTTSKGIVNSGSFSKSLSSNSLLSSGSLATTHSNGTDSRSASLDRARAGSLGSCEGSESTPTPHVSSPSYYRTLVLGGPGVGKSSLIQQFTRSDAHGDDEELSDSEAGPVISVQLDGHESTMEFIDGADTAHLEAYRADAFVLMYAVSEPTSFTLATSLLNYLRQDLGIDRTIFLVANKTDLVRQRLVPAQKARQIASSSECHFLELSTALNVNLDELLVGILCQIQRQLTPVHDAPNKPESRLRPDQSERRARSPSRALSAIGNFLKQACRREGRSRDVTPIPQPV